ncbi:MAG: DegT/DnrJ/EryC1/StrS family aminotransferase [bacterium]
MKVPFLNLRDQYISIKEEVDSVISKVLMDSAFIRGPYVKQFEHDFSRFIGTNYCTGCGNGTDALEMVISAFDFPPGSEIVVPANTFAATAEAVIRTGHIPVFADVSKDYTMDVKHTLEVCSSRTAAIIPVHLYGQPVDMDPILEFSSKQGIKVIEDAAQAHGAKYKNRNIGTLGDAAVFSFYPGKNLGAYGDAGAVVTDDKIIVENIRAFSNHGRESKRQHDFVGRNSRLDGIQAAVLSVKLKYLEKWNNHRRAVAERYFENLKDIKNIALPVIRDDVKHVWHLFAVRLKNRDKLRDYMASHGIETGIHYSPALPEQPSLKKYASGSYLACDYSEQLLSLPIGDHISKEQCDFVCETVKKFLRKQ